MTISAKAKMRATVKWIAVLLAGAVAGAALVYAYRHPVVAKAPGAQPSVEASFDTALERFITAWKAVPVSAAGINRRERALQVLLEDIKTTNGSALYNLNVHRVYASVMRQHLGARSARVLEMGPGINLGAGLVFCMLGADKYYGLDLYKDPELFGAPQYESIVKLMRLVAPGEIKLEPETFMQVAGGEVSFDARRIEYLYPRQSYDIRLPDESLDYVFSNATFEHIVDPQKTVEAIARVLVKGGVTAHQIDLRDHRDFARPLEFLKLDADAWQAVFADPANAYQYTNRRRASDFKAAFEKAGFVVVRMDATTTFEVTDAIRATLHPDFRGYRNQDLSIVGLFIVAKKPE